MASGAAPALEPKTDSPMETKETSPSQPSTLKQRIQRLLRFVFEGREEYLGWHQ
jgi:hypothetical protein